MNRKWLGNIELACYSRVGKIVIILTFKIQLHETLHIPEVKNV